MSVSRSLRCSSAPRSASRVYLCTPRPVICDLRATGRSNLLSQPSGIVEIHTGTVAETEAGVDVDLTAEAVHLSPSAKMVRETRRRYVVEGDTLTCDFWMAAMGEPLTHHLRSVLTRQP